MSAIHTENLSKTYRSGWKRDRKAAVSMLNIDVREGEIFGFLGPNGAGKTSTIHMLLNLLRPSSGAAFLFDRPVAETAVHRRIGYLPESVNLHGYYTGRALLEFYASLCGVPAEVRGARVSSLLKLLKLEEAAGKNVSKYSKGMAQRLGFAQAMLHEPDLLILDEPTASLDPVGRKEFRDILVDLKRQGKTVFISSHILSEVESICDRVAILQDGELKRIGSLQELSGGTGTDLIVKGLPSDLMAALAATSAEVTLLHGEFKIHCADETLRATVEDLLRRHRIEIVRSETTAQSLEQIFFSIINPATHP